MVLQLPHTDYEISNTCLDYELVYSGPWWPNTLSEANVISLAKQIRKEECQEFLFQM